VNNRKKGVTNKPGNIVIYYSPIIGLPFLVYFPIHWIEKGLLLFFPKLAAILIFWLGNIDFSIRTTTYQKMRTFQSAVVL
jgi:hypothetical protein